MIRSELFITFPQLENVSIVFSDHGAESHLSLRNIQGCVTPGKISELARLNIATCRLSIATCRLNIGTCRPNIGTCRSNIGTCRLNIETSRPNIGTCRPNIGAGKANVRAGGQIFEETRSKFRDGKVC